VSQVRSLPIDEKNPPADAADADFSLAEDPMLHVQRALKLAPRTGFGAVRRCLALVLITWGPIAIWANVSGYFLPEFGDPILQHLGVHVRCLLAIPLLVLSEPFADTMLRRVIGHFGNSGLIKPGDRAAFAATIRSVEGWRDSKAAWAAIASIVVAIALLASHRLVLDDPDALVWTPSLTGFDFGAWWALFVVRPVFLFLLMVWLWRLVVTWVLFTRLARLDLQLVASHPDRVGGLGFLDLHSTAFTPVVLATSSVACAAVAHRILHHGAKLADFQVTLVVMVVLLVALFLLPLSAFYRKLWRTRLMAQFQYGALAARHVLGLHQRWIEHRQVEDDVLNAPEIGPAADVQTLFQMGTKMQLIPVRRAQIISLVVAAAAPVLCVAAIEFPIQQMIISLFKMIG
jgi:hypothetical protein